MSDSEAWIIAEMLSANTSLQVLVQVAAIIGFFFEVVTFIDVSILVWYIVDSISFHFSLSNNKIGAYGVTAIAELLQVTALTALE